jgi:uncharacterized membrane protein YqiK
VIQRFGDIKKLVEQTLDPMVSAYFKNVAQTRTLIQLLQDRAAIQDLASQQMKDKFAHYNLELEEVLIGTPTSVANSGSRIEDILSQLRARQIAEEQVETYARQERAAVKQRELKEAEARAHQQQALTESEIAITVQGNQGKAEYQRSLQEASRIRALADAEAERITRVGIAQAIAAEEQVRAYGGPQFQVTQQVMSRFAEAVEKSGIELVPRVLVSHDGEGHGGRNAFEALLTVLLSERLAGSATESSPPEPEIASLKKQMREAVTTPRRAAPAA